MAKLYFRFGAMNCGKSTALMQVAYNYRERGMNTLIIKPFLDSKGNDKVVSRLGIDRAVDLLVRENDDISRLIESLLEDGKRVDCILVDEVQFLKKTHIDQLYKIAVVLNIPVICYGLRTDFLMNGFPGSERLLLLAHKIEELKTICSCGRKAVANGRKINGRFIFHGDQVAIDGKDNVEYESLCAQCYFKFREESEAV